MTEQKKRNAGNTGGIFVIVDSNFSEMEKYYKSIMMVAPRGIKFFTDIESAEKFIKSTKKTIIAVITELVFSKKGNYPELDGMDFYDRIQKEYSELHIIVLTKKIEDELDFHETFFANLIINGDQHLEKNDLSIIDFEEALATIKSTVI